ncbi:peroxiredoxin family protein (plasmid) [Burkholderia pyrrocinia]|uniref:peroxiredoxin family protein n=1 Tax=Burkholderia pyrrocinia TaxID=60550 RepID=UPI0038B681E7
MKHAQEGMVTNQRSDRRTKLIVGAAATTLLALVGAIVLLSPPQETGFSGSSSSARLAGKYSFQVGDPGPGQLAPPIRLMGTTGSEFDLASFRGKTVLLYFQEGVTCQPCWDQARDIARHFQEFHALGIDQVVTIATDPVDLMQRKAADAGLSMPVLSDPDLAVSRAYHANDYGMMGQSRDGHSFVVVGPDGRIKWRADYGGAPAYTMYLPVENLVADMRQGLRNAT